MIKKIFSLVLFILSLSLFFSWQENGKDKKNTDRRTYKSSRKNRDAQRGKGQESSMPMRKRSTSEKPCPPAAKKTCPRGCKKKCCVNEGKNESAISSSDESAIQEVQEVISTKELTPKGLPLEELKAAIEKQNSFELSELEKDQIE
ncbi:MAG: hypothetical protein KR126chlam6_00227 [Candidatus Anoxychlamydiales bacterium]|nr:hypothetical protein [Candidatus Anoxychlamydiales bacterium]